MMIRILRTVPAHATTRKNDITFVWISSFQQESSPTHQEPIIISHKRTSQPSQSINQSINQSTSQSPPSPLATMEEGTKTSSSFASSPVNVLPSGRQAIPLPSEACQEKFHPTAQPDVPLLDETTAKKRQVLNEHYGGMPDDATPRIHVLPKGEKPIRLTSEECEETFHVTSSTAVPLLEDSQH